ncbi:MAG: hypothetical protein ACLFNA_04245 [Halochromatium sp.]
MITLRSTGVDKIDTDRCRERGITVSKVPVFAKDAQCTGGSLGGT